MSGRKSNILKPQEKRSKSATKRRPKNNLNALATAEKQFPTKTKIRRHRLGDDEFSQPTRKRVINDDEDDDEDEDAGRSKRVRRDQDESDIDGGSDSEGNEWRIGTVDSDNDSDIDSDEAMGESDEDKFEGFTFRGSSAMQKKGSSMKAAQAQKRKINTNQFDGDDGDLLNEEFNGASDEEAEEEDDDLGEDAVDLATAWDMNEEDSEAEASRRKASKEKRKQVDTMSEDEDDDGSLSAVSDDEEEDDDDGESDTSELSISDNEGDTKQGLTKLRRFVTSLGQDSGSATSTRPKTALPGGDPTEFGLAPSRKLTVADLMPSISDSRMKGALKHIENDPSTKGTTGIPGKLDVPLPKRQQDRLDRAAAYDKSKETLARWIETVKANRRAEHLSFPLPEPDGLQPSKVVDSKPRTNLETTIQNILVESGLADSNNGDAEDKIQEFEELQAKKISVEEIQARRAELRKQRDLLFREEIRAKRIKKIKSKAYRRVHRKEREKLEQMEHEALAAAGVDMDEENRERNDRIRAEARMGSKHKDSKWAKSLKQTGRTAWDEDARTEMADLARREEELQKRIQGKHIVDEDGEYLSSSSEDEDDSDSDMPGFKLREKVDKLERDGTDPKDSGPYSGLLSMKFMQNADAARKEANERELREVKRQLNGEESGSEEEDLQEEVGRRKFGTQSTKSSNKPSVNLSQKEDEGGQVRNEGAENASSSDSDIDIRATPKPRQQSKAAPKKTARHGFEGTKQQSPEDDENPWLAETSKKNRSKKKTVGAAADVSLIENSGSIVAQESKQQQRSRQGYQNGSEKAEVANRPVDDDERSDDEDKATMPVLLRNEELIKRAFAGDEVLETFRKEKKKTVEEEDDKVVEDTLPGWGSWAGAGLSRSDKKRVKRTFTTVKGISADKRKDAKLDRVIINEKQVKKVRKTVGCWPLSPPIFPSSQTSVHSDTFFLHQNNKYLASQLPHPFESKQQYERALRLPIGPEWTTKSTFQTATKPRVMIKQGVIKPIQRPTL
ncbi:small nucleolar ribonucleoprotein complex subunit Utp14, putative [Trichophyton benhamiae CBS 112371]|uniref:Small nucleolar ribonucleoprotein complex subunit Utp14, putative n=2 Tax=Trichophyton TaxID=5550 RepID=D4AZ26_ARTBC|nr:small nucleolar ribonucleoprotein complex subunit Utp14, putative [Trichophyton benhamiae CBS 112371]EFE31846.1 small nucleolar ribonucleoprotein complex subunit Utp14, putative [Trichophyton benhamiae CBS 112371]